MSEHTAILVGTLTDLMGEACSVEAVMAAEGDWLPDLWSALEELGFTRIGVPSEGGGEGGAPEDVAAVVAVAARHAAPIPLAESILGGRVLAAAGLEVPTGPVAICGGADCALVEDGSVSGVLPAVTWATCARSVVLADDRSGLVFALSPRKEGAVVATSPTLAGEPRADVVLDLCEVESSASLPRLWDEAAVEREGALLRSVQMAAAIQRISEMTNEYMSAREQFGRRLAELQVVQQELAILAAQAVVARAAAECAVATPDGPLRGTAIAAAKISIGAAAGRGAAIAHQLHGAIGMTREHPLQLYTRRLWTWRDDFGSEHVWAARLGASVRGLRADEIWATLSA